MTGEPERSATSGEFSHGGNELKDDEYDEKEMPEAMFLMELMTDLDFNFFCD